MHSVSPMPTLPAGIVTTTRRMSKVAETPMMTVTARTLSYRCSYSSKRAETRPRFDGDDEKCFLGGWMVFAADFPCFILGCSWFNTADMASARFQASGFMLGC